MKNIAKAMRRKIISVSLRVKLLGIYFLGLTLLGFIGYGFFIRMEINNFLKEKGQFIEQARYFEKEAFEQLRYSVDLRNLLYKLSSAEQRAGITTPTLIGAFERSVSLIDEKKFHFALAGKNGNILSSNYKGLAGLLKNDTVSSAKIRACLQQAANKEIASTSVTVAGTAGNLPVFVVALHLEPSSNFLLSFDKNVNVNRYIASILATKKTSIINAVVLSLIIGFVATLIVVLILFFYLKSVTKDINNITSCIKSMITAEARDMRLNSKNSDEIGRMISTFNIYLQKKLNLEKFKQLIEEDSNIHDVYSRVFNLLESLGINRFAVYEVDHDKNTVQYVNPGVGDGRYGSEADMPCSEDILIDAEDCRANRLAQIVNGDEKYFSCPKFLGYKKGCGHMCIPLFIGGSVGNIVHLSIPNEQKKEFEDLAPVVMEYLKNASPVIESKQLLQSLKETTYRDCLTGLNNRRFMEEYVNILAAEAKRNNTQSAVFMCDLDHFKDVNDSYGHEAGDRVLSLLAVIIRNSVRASDIIIRYGGEEFLVVVKDIKNEEAALVLAEKLRKNVETQEMEVGPGTIVHKTISVGVAFYPLDADNFWEVVKFADAAMYAAKENGRNRIECHNNKALSLEGYGPQAAAAQKEADSA